MYSRASFLLFYDILCSELMLILIYAAVATLRSARPSCKLLKTVTHLRLKNFSLSHSVSIMWPVKQRYIVQIIY